MNDALLEPKRLVIYHRGCWDGFCAAWLLRRHAFGEDAEYVPSYYHEPVPDVTGRDVMVVDFSYPREVLERMYAEAKSLLVLDHHEGAEEDLRGLPYCVFDLDLSGAQLVWNFLVEQGAVEDLPPWLVPYTADRDLWRFELPDSKAINAALRSYPLDFGVWEMLAETNVRDLRGSGDAILRAEKTIIDEHVARAQPVVLGDRVVLAVNATSLWSDVAGELATRSPSGIGAAWFVRGDGKVQWSLRSRDEGPNVFFLARQFGGGGHYHAAGFEVEPEEPVLDVVLPRVVEPAIGP